MSGLYKERDEQRKEAALGLLRNQLRAEDELIRHYQETAEEAETLPLRYMLHMIQRDQMKHKEICQLAIGILQGEDFLKPEKEDLRKVLVQHHDLEEGSIDRLDKLIKNPWIKQIPDLHELFKTMKEDEKRHHDTIEDVLQKPFFRLDPTDLVTVLGAVDLEERQARTRAHQRRQMEKARNEKGCN